MRGALESSIEAFPAPFRDVDVDWRGERRFASAVLVLSWFRDGEGSRFAGEKFSKNFDCELCLFRAPSGSKNGGKGASKDDSTPDDPVSTDLVRLSAEDCELLRRNTTGRFADGAGTTARVFLLPFPEEDFLSGFGAGRSGEGGCTTTCEFSQAELLGSSSES